MGRSETPLKAIFVDTIREYGLINSSDKILIALSGGADSVLLLSLLSQIQKDWSITLFSCHVNHHLRGEESQRDEKFSMEISERFGILFRTRSIDVLNFARESGLSLEMAGRKLRYRELNAVAREVGCNKIATAHHLDDLAETTLLRLMKGTANLSSIPIQNGNIIRPLLFVEKSKILLYLNENKIPHITDSSNSSDFAERNYIRLRLIPTIEERFPQFRQKIKDFYAIRLEEERLWETLTAECSRFVTQDCEDWIVDKALYRAVQPVAVINRFLYRFLQEHFESPYFPNRKLFLRMERYAQENEGNKTVIQTRDYSIVSAYGNFIIHKNTKKFHNSQNYVKINTISQADSPKDFLGLIWTFESTDSPANPYANSSSCRLDCRQGDTLILRTRRNGDRIALQNGTKKIKDILIDLKIPRLMRDKTVVGEVAGRGIAFIYILGYGFRVSRDFYVDSQSQGILIVRVSGIE